MKLRTAVLLTALIGMACLVRAELQTFGIRINTVYGTTTVTPAVVSSDPMYGKIVAVDARVNTSMNITLKTVASNGLTMGIAKEIVTNVPVAATYYSTNLAETIYVHGDVLTLIASNTPAATNGKILVYVTVNKDP
jgi:NAD(P)-dependent dehydrogenase (short-subunit alcohol dehydrogenase family)